MKISFLKYFAVGLLPFLASQVTSHAQNYSISWHKVAGGGGTISNGQYVVSGTIGQHDASSSMTGGEYALTGGFWSIIAAIQQSGAPLLTITQSGNSVIVSWPSPSTGFVLQQNSTLSPATWANSDFMVTDNGATKSVTISPPSGNLFLRLKQ
jgi:hypothetical protein